MEQRVHKWKSGADVMARWRTVNAPKTITRYDLRGAVEFENEPIEKHRGKQKQTKWVPPSEDPFYQQKWAYWRKIFAESGKDLI
jgi:isopentenyl diphosphate isomerase/L-lactate dehydrogenase-like FMN-dependent dehydrogenase